MNGFEDFRVSAWLSEGLMVRAESAMRSISRVVVGATVAIAISLSSPTISIAKTSVVPAHAEMFLYTTEASQEVLGVQKMARDMELRLSGFDKNFEAPISETKRELAKRAVAAMAAGTVTGSAAWAARLLSQA